MKKLLALMALTMGIIMGAESQADASTIENIERLEVTSVGVEWTWSMDGDGKKYVLESEGMNYKKGDVVRATLNDYGEILKAEKKNIERLLVMDEGNGVTWATAYNELGETFVLDPKTVNKGDVVEVAVNMYGEIFTVKQVLGSQRVPSRLHYLNKVKVKAEDGSMVPLRFYW